MLNAVYFLTLCLLIGKGFYQALSLSIATYTQQSVCPIAFDIPVCYLIAVAYFMLLIALVIPIRRLSLFLFTLGWLPIFLIALFASLAEYQQGNICPASPSGLPLCYLSLLLSTVIAIIALMKLKHFQVISLFKHN